jgi:hypothetical protein
MTTAKNIAARMRRDWPLDAKPIRRRQAAGNPVTLLTLRLFAVGALLASAFLHLKLAVESGLSGELFTMPQLFVGQASAAAAAAIVLLTGDRGLVWLVAVGVALGSSVPILASVYFPLPAIGPFPPINEPIWYGEKMLNFAVAFTVPMLWLIRAIAPPPGEHAFGLQFRRRR